jgi:hypothetical protein
MEQYGDVHLHQSDYPDFPGTYEYEGKCRYNALDHDLYDKADAGIPLGLNRCHVEYCHPGSWQAKKCNIVKEYTPDNTNVKCKYGVFGDEPVGKYSKYMRGDTQYGSAFVHPVIAEQQDYWSIYKVLLWLFVIMVALIVGRGLWNRLRQ